MNKKYVLSILLLFGILFCSQSQEGINICTFNIRCLSDGDGNNQWVYRKDSVMSLIREYQLDIVGVQEDTKSDHLRDLRDLNEYGVVYGNSGTGTASAEWCSIFYKKLKFSVLNNGTFWLSETPDVPYSKGWDGKYARHCNWVEFKDNSTCKTFFVFNTHFDHVGVVARSNSADVIKNKVEEIVGDKPAFIMGDLNCETGSEPTLKLNSYFKQARSLTPSEKVYGGIGTFHDYGTKNPPVQIDYIYLANSDQIMIEQFTTITKVFVMNDYIMYSSDHYPVYTTATIQN